MQSLFSILFLLFFQTITFSQTYEYVYKNQSDSTYNCYLKVFPKTDSIKGLIIRDYSSLPDTGKSSPYLFTELCAENGLLTIFTVSSGYFPELFVSDSVMSVLDNLVAEVVHEHHIPPDNIFIGGISASGTRALRYAQYCEQGSSKNKIKIKGVFAVDSPLDLARFYQSVHHHQENFTGGMAWEAELMNKSFDELFRESPENNPKLYEAASVFSHFDKNGGNAIHLKNVNIILYHEPDIDWWLNERGATYFDINSYDIAAFALKLRILGNQNVKLITTTNKGFDTQGKRNCHSWTIVDEKELVNWILNQIK